MRRTNQWNRVKVYLTDLHHSHHLLVLFFTQFSKNLQQRSIGKLVSFFVSIRVLFYDRIIERLKRILEEFWRSHNNIRSTEFLWRPNFCCSRLEQKLNARISENLLTTEQWTNWLLCAQKFVYSPLKALTCKGRLLDSLLLQLHRYSGSWAVLGDFVGVSLMRASRNPSCWTPTEEKVMLA